MQNVEVFEEFHHNQGILPTLILFFLLFFIIYAFLICLSLFLNGKENQGTGVENLSG